MKRGMVEERTERVCEWKKKGGDVHLGPILRGKNICTMMMHRL